MLITDGGGASVFGDRIHHEGQIDVVDGGVRDLDAAFNAASIYVGEGLPDESKGLSYAHNACFLHSSYAAVIGYGDCKTIFAGASGLAMQHSVVLKFESGR